MFFFTFRANSFITLTKEFRIVVRLIFSFFLPSYGFFGWQIKITMRGKCAYKKNVFVNLMMAFVFRIFMCLMYIYYWKNFDVLVIILKNRVFTYFNFLEGVFLFFFFFFGIKFITFFLLFLFWLLFMYVIQHTLTVVSFLFRCRSIFLQTIFPE